jgi:sulfur-carrier protein
MRDLTAGLETVDVSGSTVRQVIDALDRACPGIKDRLCVGKKIDPALAVHIDGRIAQRGLLTPVSENSEIHFLPAIAGG